MTELDRALDALPRRFPGPGGAVAVLKEGAVVAQHAWGWANAERRIPFTRHTLFRMCSITKQFTCATVLDAFPDPTALDADVRAHLPNLEQSAPGALHLCHNQSGLRDYWAVAMLHGSLAEAPFGDIEAGRVIQGTRTLQFAPGTRYSYCNQNFRVLSDILQNRTGRSFAELLRTRVFEPAGMDTALLAADTRAMPDGTEGYEGTQATGFRPAPNRIVWTGDAGLGASLEDMIAWERHIDRTRDDPASLYARLSAPVTFADGTPARYGFGLGRRTQWGREIIGHGGALRGWRSHRLHVRSERASVVVLFNHLSDAQSAAMDILAALLGEAPAKPAADLPIPAWCGAFLEPETGLSARIEPGPPGRLRLRYTLVSEVLDVQADGTAGNPAADTVLRPGEGGVWMDRPGDNQSSRLEPIQGAPGKGIAGRFRCRELDADLTVVDTGGIPYGAFSGVLGQSRMELLDHVAGDVWALPCPRALDHTAPGDWTLAFQRDASGQVDAVTVGCWIARRLTYRRLE